MRFEIAGLSYGGLQISNVSGGAQVRYDGDDTIFFDDISANQLTQDNFVFA